MVHPQCIRCWGRKSEELWFPPGGRETGKSAVMVQYFAVSAVIQEGRGGQQHMEGARGNPRGLPGEAGYIQAVVQRAGGTCPREPGEGAQMDPGHKCVKDRL